MCGKIVSSVLLLSLLVGCRAHPSMHGSERYRGAQWMGWDDLRRDAFVVSYVDGYKSGTADACRGIDQSLDLKAGKIPEHGKDEIVTASGVCRVNATDYSHCTPGAPEGEVCGYYTRTITQFYSKHPEYQNIPYEYLMTYMTDKENKTADQLYAKAKYGEIRNNW
jgi:hypothetical protein